MDRRIIWHKWRDPMAAHLSLPERDDDEELDVALRDDSLDSFSDSDVAVAVRSGSYGPGVMGPLGIVPLNEHNAPSRLWNFWMGHANFDVTPEIVRRICGVPGVESLDLFSRYRFRLGIGKAFDPSAVRLGVEAAAGGRLAEMAVRLGRLHRHWAIYVMPTGKLEAVGGATAQDVKKRGQAHEEEASQVVRSW